MRVCAHGFSFRCWASSLVWITTLLLLPLGLSAREIRGEVTERPIDDLERAWDEAVAASTTHWVGWSVEAPPTVKRSRSGFCRIVLDNGHQRWSDGGAGSVNQPDSLLLFEVGKGRVEGVQVSDTSCDIDARGVGLELWLGVSTAQSFDLIAGTLLLDGDADERESGLGALAGHDDPRADVRLERAAAEDPDEDVRHAAIFWLGEARGAGGYQALRRLEERLPAYDLEEALVFAYHVSEEAAATERLLHLARYHDDSEVREQALFWVAQEASDLAIATLERAVDEDPDSEVRQAAVFGLTQLPEERGIPALLRVAKTHPDPEVREDAFFWLGQSGDPRALELFAEILADGR